MTSNHESNIYLLVNLLFLSFVFLCSVHVFMITETIFIGSAERPPNTLCQHGPNHETQNISWTIHRPFCIDNDNNHHHHQHNHRHRGLWRSNSKNYWSGRSARKERRCSQIGGRPLKAKLGTINKYLEILARTASQGWEGMQPMLMIFLFHIKKIVWQCHMRILSNIVTNHS